MRLAAVELLDQAADRLREPIDAIVATSLMSVADLRAMLPARLRSTPVILYMHENQAAYPLSDHPKVDPKRDVHFALTNLTSILAADLVIWNSLWNKASFLEGMDGILRRASAVELAGWQQKVEQRSRVIWPPVEAPPEACQHRREAGQGDSVGVVWPHRWEHDKGPQELLEIAERYSERLDLRWTILGWQYPDVPPALAEFKARFAPRIDHFGYDHRFAKEDFNANLPCDRLKEMVADGELGSVANDSIVLMGLIPNVAPLVEETIPRIVEKFQSDSVEAALLVPS